MASERTPDWLEDIETFGARTLVKLVLAAVALLYIAMLISLMPGREGLGDMVQSPIPGLVSTVVTSILLVLIYLISTQARTLIEDIDTASTTVRDSIGMATYWFIILIGLLVAYQGFGDTGRHVLTEAGLEVLYPMIFVILGIVPFTILLVELGIYVQLRAREERTEQDTSQAEDLPSSSLKSNAEQVQHALNRHGGRMYQSDMAEETGWSKPKVSYVLSDMEDDGVIVRYQVGRQKIVCLPGHEPEVVGQDSPTEQ